MFPTHTLLRWAAEVYKQVPMYLVWQLILEIYLFLSERTEPIRQSSKFVFKAPAVMLSLQAVLLAKLLLWESLISFSCFPREDIVPRWDELQHCLVLQLVGGSTMSQIH